MLPFITCLCPTYRRPKLLENSIACFMSQDYPLYRRRLLILDDAGQIQPQSSDGWEVLSTPVRFPNLPHKYKGLFAASQPKADIVCIWEDDDIYLPHHLSAHEEALRGDRLWSKSSKVLSTYTGKPELEVSTGRFFASIAIKRELWQQVGGLQDTARADFDQQFLSALKEAGGSPADPLEGSRGILPGYVFRWGSTAAYHGQGAMRSPDDTTWYDRCKDEGDKTPVGILSPKLDEESKLLLEFAKKV